MSKEEVLKLDPTMKSGACPKDSMKIDGDGDFCYFNFYCKENICYSSNEVDLANNVNGQIIEDKCKSDNDCLSSICKKGKCDNSGITQCLVPRKTTVIHCGKLGFQNCQTDDECASNKCSNNVCEILNQKEISIAIGTVFLLALAFFLIVVPGCIGIIYCLCNRNKKQKTTSV